MPPTIIKNVNGNVTVNNYNQSPKPNDGPQPVTVNTRDASLKLWVYEMADKIKDNGEPGLDPKYGGSTLGAECFRIGQQLIGGDDGFDRRHKILRYIEPVKAMLDKLD